MYKFNANPPDFVSFFNQEQDTEIVFLKKQACQAGLILKKIVCLPWRSIITFAKIK
jgi:catalase (peroxidase I)